MGSDHLYLVLEVENRLGLPRYRYNTATCLTAGELADDVWEAVVKNEAGIGKEQKHSPQDVWHQVCLAIEKATDGDSKSSEITREMRLKEDLGVGLD